MSSASHMYAIDIEWTLCDVFGCGRCGFGGIADADFIERGMYTAMVSALATYYKNAHEKKQKEIEQFLNKYGFYNTKRIEEIIEEYGEQEVKTIIKEFQGLIKTLKP